MRGWGGGLQASTIAVDVDLAEEPSWREIASPFLVFALAWDGKQDAMRPQAWSENGCRFMMDLVFFERARSPIKLGRSMKSLQTTIQM